MRKRIFEKTYSEKPLLRTLVCQDCGQTLETSESPSHALCPNCGGTRMNIKLFPVKKTLERKSVFENHDTPLESKLKTFSGKSLSKDEFQKEFSDLEEVVLEKSYATITDNNVTFRSDAYGMEKAFSKLIISVTKTLELDPTIMSGGRSIKEVIKHMHGVPEKGILMLKKAHNLPENFGEESDKEKEDWVEDSNICQDLKEEFGGKTFGLEEFINIIRERYPDAPRNIYEILENKGAISLDGTKVNILH